MEDVLVLIKSNHFLRCLLLKFGPHSCSVEESHGRNREAKSLFPDFSRRDFRFFPVEISILEDPEKVSLVFLSFFHFYSFSWTISSLTISITTSFFLICHHKFPYGKSRGGGGNLRRIACCKSLNFGLIVTSILIILSSFLKKNTRNTFF